VIVAVAIIGGLAGCSSPAANAVGLQVGDCLKLGGASDQPEATKATTGFSPVPLRGWGFLDHGRVPRLHGRLDSVGLIRGARTARWACTVWGVPGQSARAGAVRAIRAHRPSESQRDHHEERRACIGRSSVVAAGLPGIRGGRPLRSTAVAASRLEDLLVGSGWSRVFPGPSVTTRNS
jgi:hypothetical protein